MEKFVATGKGCHVAGRVWMDGGGAQTLWNFVVLLGSSIVAREGVQWAGLLPAEDATGWLSLDFENRFMKVKASAAFRTSDKLEQDKAS